MSVYNVKEFKKIYKTLTRFEEMNIASVKAIPMTATAAIFITERKNKS